MRHFFSRIGSAVGDLFRWVAELIRDLKPPEIAVVMAVLTALAALVCFGCSPEQWGQVQDASRDAQYFAGATTQPTQPSAWLDVGRGILDAAAVLYPPIGGAKSIAAWLFAGVGALAGVMRTKRKLVPALIEVAGDIAAFKQPDKKFEPRTEKVLADLGLHEVAKVEPAPVPFFAGGNEPLAGDISHVVRPTRTD